MHGHRCQRCGMYWASQAHPDLHIAITKLCPICLPKVAPPMGWNQQRQAS